MKKLLISTLCILTLVGCTSKKETALEPTASSETIEIPTPFIEVNNLEEAIKETGFDITVPNDINGTSPSLFLVYNDEFNMIEVRYENGKDITYIRKNKGIEENLSGNYNTYDNVYTVSINKNEIHLRANDELVFVGEWNKDGYSYSLSTSTGFNEEAFLALVSSIN